MHPVGLALALMLVLTGFAYGSPGLSVSGVGISGGQILTGAVTWTAQIAGAPNRVDFSIDGSVRYTATAAPYTYGGAGNTLDTTTLSNGSHVFAVTAYPNRGKDNGVSVSVTAAVSNAAPAPSPQSTPPPATAPTATAAPAISGTPIVGQTLSSSIGSWSGTTPMTYGYQWQLCTSGGSCAAVSGATASSFVVPNTAVGSTVEVVVTATNTAGHASATSPATVSVTAATTSLPPVSTALPSVNGSAVVGQTLSSTAGSWSGTTPMTYGYKWLACNSSGGSCTPVTGATSASFSVVGTLVGQTLRVAVTARNTAGSVSVQSAPTAAVTAAVTLDQTETFDSETAYLDGTLPNLTNAITVSSASAFTAAVANAKAGQTIDVLGNVQIPGEFTGFNRVVSGGTVNVVFQPGAGFTGPSTSQTPAVWIRNSGGWRIWGGTITNRNGNGILMYGTPGPFTWTGFRISNTGDTCVALYPVGGNINGVTLKGLAGTADPNLAWDPHAEKGTGIHAWNIADVESTSYLVENTTIAADTVDQATGAAVELDTGHTGPNVTIYARAKHVGFPIPGTSWQGYATQQTAGNVVQLWGASLAGTLDLKYMEGNDIQGRILQTDGMYSGASLANARIDYGVATGPILLNPTLSKLAYDVRDGIHLAPGVSPLP